MGVLSASIFGYVCGALPTGVWVARRAGVDIRRAGSGNVGATNVARSVGARAALATLIGDVAKGFFPAWVAGRFAAGDEWSAAAAGAAAVVGHVFPLFGGFAGGKGVATVLGAYLALAPVAALSGAVVFAVVSRRSGFVSLGSLVSVALLPALAWITRAPTPAVVAALPLAGLVFVRHRDNIRRLHAGSEPRFRVRQ